MHNARSWLVLGADKINDAGLQWIDVIPTADKARNGRWYFTITREDLDVYAQSIRDNAGLIPVDYDHEGADGGSSVAAGWFTGECEIVDRDGESVLRAEVKWTPQAAQEIGDGRYKRLSPEFDFVDRDEKTGLLTKAKEILAATLTNRPFFRQLAPVGADDPVVWDSAQGLEWLRDRLSAAVNPDRDDYRFWVMDVMPGAALIREARTARTWVASFDLTSSGVALQPQSLWTEAKQEWVQATEAALESAGRRPSPRKEHDMDAKVLAKSLGLPEDATDEQITEAVEAARQKADDHDTVKAELDTLKAAAGDETEAEKLRKELDDLKKERADEKVETILAAAVTERRIDPAAKTVLAEQFSGNPDGLKTLVEAMAPRPVTARGSGGAGRDDGDPDTTAAARDFETADEYDVDDDSLTLHVKAEKLLADQGKPRGKYDEDDYAWALNEAARETAAA